jgi:hypothetical protein
MPEFTLVVVRVLSAFLAALSTYSFLAALSTYLFLAALSTYSFYQMPL